jgi:phosphoribosylamine--glycine ligase
MNILLVGSGGREHALAWKIAASPLVGRLVTAPGNPGLAALCETRPIKVTDVEALVALAQEIAADLVVVGPESALERGLADRLAGLGIPCFGPTQEAAQLETSKAFTKDFTARHNIPTAAYGVFEAAGPAKAFLDGFTAPYVIKADGLAAGKGVIVAMTLQEALDAIDEMFSGAFGGAGAEVVIEEFMTGEEASFFVLTDGTNALPIGTAQDHKRVGDGDTGPNTGGMGAYSPAPVLTDAIAARAMAEIVLPTIREMARRGTPYQGVLYAGLMIKEGQGRLVEYNARFGDPETQVLMMRLGAQALDLMLACAEGRLDQAQVNWADDHAITVVMAAKGYPGSYQKGSEIRGLPRMPEDSRHMVFHAGTTEKDGRICANGGRVLNVTARGESLAEARNRAYAMIDHLDWPEGFCRSDIGWRAL